MTAVVYVSVDDWITIAALVLETTDATIRRVANLDLADSALHAPTAGFGDTEFYPDLYAKAAVLGWHLTMNHPLPDGNKRPRSSRPSSSSNATVPSGPIPSVMMPSP